MTMPLDSVSNKDRIVSSTEEDQADQQNLLPQS